MSRDVVQDAFAVARLLSGFVRVAIKRTGPITERQVQDCRESVQAFKNARPGLHPQLVRELDGAVNSLQEAYRDQ